MSTQSPSESQPTFTGAIPVLPTTNMSQATRFYGQLGFQVLHQEYQIKGLLASNAAVRHTPWGTKEFVVFDPDRVLITFVERTP